MIYLQSRITAKNEDEAAMKIRDEHNPDQICIKEVFTGKKEREFEYYILKEG